MYVITCYFVSPPQTISSMRVATGNCFLFYFKLNISESPQPIVCTRQAFIQKVNE